MDNTKSNFKKRKNEINEYFSFLKILNYENVSLKYNTINGTHEVEMSIKLQRILVANTFLLLYNLVESTVRNSIIEIYNQIKDDELTYANLSDKIKQIWIYKNSKKLTSSNEEKIKKSLKKVIDEIISNEIIILTKDDIHISGNINADEIRILASKIGFEKSNNGRYLDEIKIKRNRLAHGEQTFHDVGKDFTYNDLNLYKENTFEHLEDVMKNIKKFIEDKKYFNYLAI